MTLLQELADTDHDGVVSEQEGRAADEALNSFHEVRSGFDKLIDFAGKGFIDAMDIAQVWGAAFIPAERAFSSETGPFKVSTKADDLLDEDSDGLVTEKELDAAAQALLDGGGFPDVPRKIMAAFDTDGNGTLDEQETRLAVESFRPHPVDPSHPLDVELDVHHIGFLTPEQIGIGAGVSSKGGISTLDNRIDRLRLLRRIRPVPRTAVIEPLTQPPLTGREPASVTDTTGEARAEQTSKPQTASGAAPASALSSAMPEASQKRIDLTGKKLAVMGLTSATKNVSQESIEGTAIFLEDAFVNVGSASIVDRSAINKVMKELELQSSAAFSDNSTAAKVGRLSGAEIIATGTISLVGRKYYLNVKLVSVDTGEILRSSIAAADSEEGFLDMCQEAVVKLF